MLIEPLLIKARKSIGRFCFEECHAYCCRKGNLNLTAKQATRMPGAVSLSNQTFSLSLNNPMGCPMLCNNQCTIHKEKWRPSACKEFPLFYDGKTLRVSSRCTAVNAGLLYPFLAKIHLAGVPITYSNIDSGEWLTQNLDFESIIKFSNPTSKGWGFETIWGTQSRTYGNVFYHGNRH